MLFMFIIDSLVSILRFADNNKQRNIVNISTYFELDISYRHWILSFGGLSLVFPLLITSKKITRKNRKKYPEQNHNKKRC